MRKKVLKSAKKADLVDEAQLEKERRAIEFARLCCGCLEDIVEWADHYVKPPARPLANQLDKACERMRQIADDKKVLYLAINDLFERCQIFGFPWPKKLPAWLPKSAIKKQYLVPRKRTKIVVYDDVAEVLQKLAFESDKSMDSIFDKFTSDLIIEEKVRRDFTRKYDRKARKVYWVKDPAQIDLTKHGDRGRESV